MHNQTIHDTGVISQFEMINLAEIDHLEADTLVVSLDQPLDAGSLPPISYRCNRIANFLDNGKLYGPWSQVSPKGKLILLLSPPTQNQITFYSNNTPALTPGILVNTDAYRFP